MAKHNDTGARGESLAVEALTAKGYAIVERNWRVGHYEVDIVAATGTTLVFCEVKTRTNEEDDPFEALTRKKLVRLVRSAHAYVEMYECPQEIRFDAILITGEGEDCKLEHIEDMDVPVMRSIR